LEHGRLQPECLDYLTELRDDISRLTGVDWKVGFVKTNRPWTAPGCATATRYVVGHQTAAIDWRITQHESSHLFGALDRYENGEAGGNDDHEDDVMEDPYGHANHCSNEVGDGDWQIIRSNRARYDG